MLSYEFFKIVAACIWYCYFPLIRTVRESRQLLALFRPSIVQKITTGSQSDEAISAVVLLYYNSAETYYLNLLFTCQ